MKHLFIVNPTAGGKDKSIAVSRMARAAFENREEEYEVYITKAPMDAAEKIRTEAACCDHLRVYACGGDGTFNECVCGAAQLDNVAATPFPTGTGNDFCRMFGKEKDLFRDLEALLNGTEYPIDLIDCNGRWCVNICSVGIDARIGSDVHRYSGLPLVHGTGAYIVSAVANILKGVNRSMRVEADGYAAEQPHALVCACNGRYYGGGFNPSLHARPDDGILDFYIVPGVSMPTLVRYFGAYATGKADRYPRVIRHLQGDHLHIEFEEESVVNVDGEAIYAKTVDLRLVPRAMRLIVPAGMGFFEDSGR